MNFPFILLLETFNFNLYKLGLVLVKFSGLDKANIARSTKQVVYITDSCKGVYLSREACEQLGLISEIFPTIGEHSVRQSTVGASVDDMEVDPDLPPPNCYTWGGGVDQ